MENKGPMALKVLQTFQTCSGLVYKDALSTPELSTPSSSPPVMPTSISSQHFMALILLKYLAQVAIFSSSNSSDKSNMWLEKKGFTMFLEVSFISLKHAIKPFKEFLGTMITVNNNWNTIMLGHQTNMLSSSN